MTAASLVLDRYRCPEHSFVVGHIDAEHRPRLIPCAYCNRLAEFEREEGVA